MKNLLKKSLLLGTILFLTSCSFTSGSNESNSIPDSSDDNNSNEEETDDPITDAGVALESSKEYLTFWETSSVLNFSISMSNDVAYKISSLQNNSTNYYSDFYFPCTLTITVNGTEKVFEEAGIRMKGNTSRTEFADEEGNFINDCHFKIKLNETFDDDAYANDDNLKAYYHDWSSDKTGRKARKNRTFCDMEKLNIKWNKNYDETRSKQSYAYKVLRDNGIISPHSTLSPTTLSITKDGATVDTKSGVYEVIEEVDDILISRYFSEEAAAGDLYKLSWSCKFQTSDNVGEEIGVEDFATYFHPKYDLKTNKKTSTHTDLLNFISIMADTTSSAETYKTKLESCLDVNSFLMSEACMYLIGDPDDFRNNMNNCYVYFDSLDHKAYFIPYDIDRCFGIGVDWNPDGNWLKTVDALSTKMKGNGNSWQQNNLYWRTIISTTDSSSNCSNIALIKDYQTQYKNDIKKIVNEYDLSVTSFENYVNSFPASYRGTTTETGSHKGNDDTYNISFKEYFEAKLNTCSSIVNG